MFGFFTTHR
ncbi:hypothetical protein D047_2156A, partial [Vibrio parahaemolyticus VPTS-2010_2]